MSTAAVRRPALHVRRHGKFLLGDTLTGTGVSNASDLPRFKGRALIGDPRNDENSIVSQFQALMLRFHNRMVDDNDGLPFEACSSAFDSTTNMSC